MLRFTSSLSQNTEAFAIFVNEKHDYKDKKVVLSNNTKQKINSFLKISKAKKNKDEINSVDISDKQKCFIIKIKDKYESYFPEEIGGNFFSYLKKFKHITDVNIYVDSLNFDKEKVISFSSQFIFGFNLKSYKFNKYKTINRESIDKNINTFISSPFSRIESQQT